MSEYELCLRAMAKVAYNFWPVVLFMVGWFVWEWSTEPARTRNIKR